VATREDSVSVLSGRAKDAVLDSSTSRVPRSCRVRCRRDLYFLLLSRPCRTRA